MPKYFAYYADGQGPRQKITGNLLFDLVSKFEQIVENHRHFFKPQSLHMQVYDARPNKFRLVARLSVGPYCGVQIKRIKPISQKEL